MATLHLICGLPGSGKSTLAKELEREHPALRLTPDEWIAQIVGDGRDEQKRAVIESIQWELAQRILRLGVDVILEAGFWSRKERDEFRAMASQLGANVKLYYLDVPKHELWRRLQKRNAETTDETFHVNESDLDEWIKSFEVPTLDETPTSTASPNQVF